MRTKIGNWIVTALEVIGIAGLTGIAVNAECKRHKAEKAKEKAELEADIYKFISYMDGIKIKDLEEELEELRSKKKA